MTLPPIRRQKKGDLRVTLNDGKFKVDVHIYRELATDRHRRLLADLTNVLDAYFREPTPSPATPCPASFPASSSETDSVPSPLDIQGQR